MRVVGRGGWVVFYNENVEQRKGYVFEYTVITDNFSILANKELFKHLRLCCYFSTA